MIPQIDKEIGISVYTTDSSSVSGKIKQNENDFLVREILSEKTNLGISEALFKQFKSHIHSGSKK